jgi:hypothetical protein
MASAAFSIETDRKEGKEQEALRRTTVSDKQVAIRINAGPLY